MYETGLTEILLIEDNPYDAELTVKALKKNHVSNRIMHVKDGAEALDFLLATGVREGKDIPQHIKIILLDLKLPKVDGLEVLQKIKSNEQTKLIPVVVLTSSKVESDIDKSYQFGANGYIVKPVGFDNFTKAIVGLGMYWLLINQPPS
jgi:two-component system, response regulator